MISQKSRLDRSVGDHSLPSTRTTGKLPNSFRFSYNSNGCPSRSTVGVGKDYHSLRRKNHCRPWLTGSPSCTANRSQLGGRTGIPPPHSNQTFSVSVLPFHTDRCTMPPGVRQRTEKKDSGGDTPSLGSNLNPPGSQTVPTCEWWSRLGIQSVKQE